MHNRETGEKRRAAAGRDARKSGLRAGIDGRPAGAAR